MRIILYQTEALPTTMPKPTFLCITNVLHFMPRSDTGNDENDEKVNLRLPADFLADLDERWQKQGYNSRSEFMREALRDAVYGTRLSKQAMEDLVVSDQQFSEGETVHAEDARDRFGTDE